MYVHHNPPSDNKAIAGQNIIWYLPGGRNGGVVTVVYGAAAPSDCTVHAATTNKIQWVAAHGQTPQSCIARRFDPDVIWQRAHRHFSGALQQFSSCNYAAHCAQDVLRLYVWILISHSRFPMAQPKAVGCLRGQTFLPPK